MQCVQTCEDWRLLEDYARTKSDKAFRELVERHGKWVFAAAYRQLGDRHLAQDATQVVFILLARRADAMHSSTKVSGWLFKTLRFTVKNLLRTSRRRMTHEQRAAMARPEDVHGIANGISDLALELDRAVGRLSHSDRTVILLRFYQDCSFQQISEMLDITEEAAQKRVSRAVDCLRKRLGSRIDGEVVSAVAAIGTGLAPMNLISNLTTVAMAVKAGAALPISIAALTKGTVWLMVMTKLQTAVLVTGACLLVGVPAALAAAHYMTRPPVQLTGATIPVAATSGAVAEPSADLALFNRIYSMKPGENVKRIAPPFNDARRAGYESLAQAAQARREAAAADEQAGMNRSGGFGMSLTPDQIQSLMGARRGGSAGGGGGGGGGSNGGGGSSMLIGGGSINAGGATVGQGMSINGAVMSPDDTPPDQRAAQDGVPTALLIKWEEGKPGQLFGPGEAGARSISDLLIYSIVLNQDTVLNMGFDNHNIGFDVLEGDKALLGRRITGDFLLRATATDDQIRAGYEKIFSDVLGTRVTLKFKEVEKKVIVLRGKWDYKPVDQAAADGTPNIHIYATDMKSKYGGGRGSNDNPKSSAILSPLMTELKTPILLEAEGIPADLAYTLHDARGKDVNAKALLDHLTEQTGLRWTEETRKVRHLLIETSKP